jgi:hypothetical protein
MPETTYSGNYGTGGSTYKPASAYVAPKATPTPPRRAEITLAKKGTLLLSKELQDQIKYLHSKVGAKEWCGVLFYRKVDGDISDPENLVLRAEGLFLMDIGRETYTDADFDADNVVDMYEAKGDDVAMKTGLIHTHHNMTTFFSGTDMAELHDNTHLHNYYLSLIVNFSGVYAAKVAFIVKKHLTYKNAEDVEVTTVAEELLAMIDLNIEKEEEEMALPETFLSRYEKVKQETTKVTPSYTAYTGNNGVGYNSRPQAYAPKADTGNWDDDDDSWFGAYEGGYDGYADVDSEGNLKGEGRTFVPKTKMEKGVEEMILTWLAKGMGVFTDMPKLTFLSIDAYLDWFENYFKDDVDDKDKQHFLDKMQTYMGKIFGGYSPNVIQRIGGSILDAYNDKPMGLDLAILFEAYPQYLIELGKTKKENKMSGLVAETTEVANKAK